MANYPYHQSLQLKNFTVFRDTSFEFVPGVNVFVGENGTGKTHLMKVLYAAQRRGTRSPFGYIDGNLLKLFQTLHLTDLIRKGTPETGYWELNGIYNDKEWQFNLQSEPMLLWLGPVREILERPVFIPTADMMGLQEYS